MKKFSAIFFALLMFALAFAGCSSNDEKPIPEGQITTEGARLTGNDAIAYIRDSYTIEELGLENVKDDYKLMVNNNGIVYDDENYIKVVANVISENEGVTAEDGSQTYSLTPVGEYLIAFDCSKVLKKNMDAENEYTKLENKTADYSAKGESTSQTK